MNGAELLTRRDTKAIISAAEVAPLLSVLAPDYRALEVDGHRRSLYRTVYLDTPDLDFYRDHHNGRAGRNKVRYRTYVESGLSFFEVKHKTNKGITEKTRVAVEKESTGARSAAELELLADRGLAELPLRPVVRILYGRITLVSTSADERVTIDTEMSAHASTNSHTWPDHAIVEVKQPRLDRNSPFFSALTSLGHRPSSVSKYCISVATCSPDVKRNRFLRRLRRLGVSA
jgi:hypothetical protein